MTIKGDLDKERSVELANRVNVYWFNLFLGDGCCQPTDRIRITDSEDGFRMPWVQDDVNLVRTTDEGQFLRCRRDHGK